jgi:hypothetical protein
MTVPEVADTFGDIIVKNWKSKIAPVMEARAILSSRIENLLDLQPKFK